MVRRSQVEGTNDLKIFRMLKRTGAGQQPALFIVWEQTTQFVNLKPFLFRSDNKFFRLVYQYRYFHFVLDNPWLGDRETSETQLDVATPLLLFLVDASQGVRTVSEYNGRHSYNFDEIRHKKFFL